MRISSNQIYQSGLSNILAQQERNLTLNTQVTTRLRVQSPSDDPIATAQIELMKQRINLAELYKNNIQSAKAKLSNEEGILNSATSALQKLREIQVSSNKSTLSDDDRKTLANQAKEIMNELQDYANSKDETGFYLFAGSQVTAQPITMNSTGQYVYNGNDTQRYQQISNSMQVAVTDTADNIFMRIPSGNGKFTVAQTTTPNTGTAVATTGNITNSSPYIQDNYTMSFALNSQGQLVVMVSGANTGNVLPPTGLPDDAPLYQDGASIAFNGMQIAVSGTPLPGDAFAINPAQNVPIFATIQSMINNLSSPRTTSADTAAAQTISNQLLDQIDNALENVIFVKSDLGGRMSLLESMDDANETLIEVSLDTLKELREVDPIAVTAEFEAQVYNLQIAQKAFSMLQGLSIFNYI